MKNQYFGDVNDYRKYGLLRRLAGDGEVSIGICWMLTPNDHRPDGEKTEYLDDANLLKYQHFDPELYDFLRRKVHGHETEDCSRDIRNFSNEHLPGGHFWPELIGDPASDRDQYFETMWKDLEEKRADLVFFDPDDGLANNSSPKRPLRKGHKDSSKKLFRDEVSGTLDKGFSVLLYQHFDRTNRSDLVTRLGAELAGLTESGCAYSFWTPHVFFLLAPLEKHRELIDDAVQRVEASPWATKNSAPTSKSNLKRQILVTRHVKSSEVTHEGLWT